MLLPVLLVLSSKSAFALTSFIDACEVMALPLMMGLSKQGKR